MSFTLDAPARRESVRVSASRRSLLAIAGLIAMMLLWFAAGGLFSSSPSPVESAKALLRSAEVTANSVAAQDGGSYAHVGQLNLHKYGWISFTPSSRNPWVSAASGTADSYTITVTAEPGGRTFSITHHRAPSGGRA